MPWEKPTLKELRERAEEDLSIRLLDGSPLNPRGVLSTIATMRAGGEYLMFYYLYWAFQQIFPDKAELEFLNDWARVWGVSRKPAVAAQGAVEVKGVAGAALMDDSLAKGTGDVQYRVAGVILTPADAGAGAGASAGGPAGVGACACVCVDAGARGNLPAGAKISLISPQTGITSELTVGPDGLTGGVDEESDDALRGRLLKTIQAPPHGGNKADYEMWALETPGVLKALCTPTYSGVGTVAVAVWGEPHAPILPEITVKAAYDHILKQAPVTAGPGLYVYTPTTLPVNVRLKLIPDTPQNRENVIRELGDVFAAEANPGEAIPLTHLAEAVSLASGEYDHVMYEPTANITPAMGVLPILGEVTFDE